MEYTNRFGFRERRRLAKKDEHESRCEKLTGGIQVAILLLETGIDSITIADHLRDPLQK